MKRGGIYSDRLCRLILELQDGPKTVACLVELLGMEPTRSSSQTVLRQLRNFERHGIVVCARQPSSHTPSVFEWVTQ